MSFMLSNKKDSFGILNWNIPNNAKEFFDFFFIFYWHKTSNGLPKNSYNK